MQITEILKSLTRLAGVIIALAFLAVPGRADGLSYLMTGSGDTITFQLPQTFVPGPCAPFPDCFGFSSIPVTINGITSSDQVDLFDVTVGGGITIQQGQTLLINLSSIQGNHFVPLFMGTLSNPILSTGAWFLSNQGVSPQPLIDHPFDLAVTAPEPTSLTLLSTGLLGLLGFSFYKTRLR